MKRKWECWRSDTLWYRTQVLGGTLEQAMKRYSSTRSLTSALDGGRVINSTLRVLYPRGRKYLILVEQEVG
jgi:hypothetical protein